MTPQKKERNNFRIRRVSLRLMGCIVGASVLSMTALLWYSSLLMQDIQQDKWSSQSQEDQRQQRLFFGILPFVDKLAITMINDPATMEGSISSKTTITHPRYQHHAKPSSSSLLLLLSTNSTSQQQHQKDSTLTTVPKNITNYVTQSSPSHLPPVNIIQDMEHYNNDILPNDKGLYLPLQSTSYSWSHLLPPSQQDSITEQVRSKRSLGFLHIPKTGGSSIETAAAKVGIRWGKCLFVNYTQCRTNHHSSYAIEPENQRQRLLPVHQRMEWLNQTRAFQDDTGNPPLWHVPIQHLPTNPTSPYHDQATTIIDPYQDQDLFVVVRNPYSRVVSEYYYACQQKIIKKCHLDSIEEQNRNDPQTAASAAAARMNQKLLRLLYRISNQFHNNATGNNITTSSSASQQQQDQQSYHHSSFPLSPKKYFMAEAHWIPQWDYIYSTNPKTSSDATSKDEYIKHNHKDDVGNSDSTTMIHRRQVQHIVHFEHLSDQFQSLMNAYHLPVNLSSVPKQLVSSNARRAVKNKEESKSASDADAAISEFYVPAAASALSSQTRKWIEQWYAKDFELGPYIMIEATKEARLQYYLLSNNTPPNNNNNERTDPTWCRKDGNNNHMSPSSSSSSSLWVVGNNRLVCR